MSYLSVCLAVCLVCLAGLLRALQRRQRRGVPPQPVRQVVRLGRELQVPRALLHPRLVPAGDASGADGAAPAGRLHVQFPGAQEEEGTVVVNK